MSEERAALVEAMAMAMNDAPMNGSPRKTLWREMDEWERSYWRRQAAHALDAALAVRGETTCPECKGKGLVLVLPPHQPHRWESCAVCGGSGSVLSGSLLILRSDAVLTVDELDAMSPDNRSSVVTGIRAALGGLGE